QLRLRPRTCASSSAASPASMRARAARRQASVDLSCSDMARLRVPPGAAGSAATRPAAPATIGAGDQVFQGFDGEPVCCRTIDFHALATIWLAKAGGPTGRAPARNIDSFHLLIELL